MRKTTQQLREEMKMGGVLMKVMTLASVIARSGKGSRAERAEVRDILVDVMKDETLSTARYMAYMALQAQVPKNEAVRRSVEEFEADPRNARIIAFMSGES